MSLGLARLLRRGYQRSLQRLLSCPGLDRVEHQQRAYAVTAQQYAHDGQRQRAAQAGGRLRVHESRRHARARRLTDCRPGERCEL